MKQAKATEADLKVVWEFLQDLEEIVDKGNLLPNYVLRFLSSRWPAVSVSWRRVVNCCEVLIANCCDPELDYLEWKPDIKKLIEEAAQDATGATAAEQDGP